MRVCLCLCLCREYEIQEFAIPGTCSVIQMHQELVAHTLWPTLKQETWVVSQIFRSWRGLCLRFSALAFPCAVVVSFRSFWQEGGCGASLCYKFETNSETKPATELDTPSETKLSISRELDGSANHYINKHCRGPEKTRWPAPTLAPHCHPHCHQLRDRPCFA